MIFYVDIISISSGKVVNTATVSADSIDNAILAAIELRGDVYSPDNYEYSVDY